SHVTGVQTCALPISAQYHQSQIQALCAAGADMISAMTMTNADEATGIVNAARAVSLPVAISFTVETNGTLPTGQSLGDTIAQVEIGRASCRERVFVW